MQVIDLIYKRYCNSTTKVCTVARNELLCDFHPFEGAGVDTHWFSVYRVDTRSVPLRRCRDQFKRDINKTLTHFRVSQRFQTPIRWNHYYRPVPNPHPRRHARRENSLRLWFIFCHSEAVGRAVANRLLLQAAACHIVTTNSIGFSLAGQEGQRAK